MVKHLNTCPSTVCQSLTSRHYSVCDLSLCCRLLVVLRYTGSVCWPTDLLCSWSVGLELVLRNPDISRETASKFKCLFKMHLFFSIPLLNLQLSYLVSEQNPTGKTCLFHGSSNILQSCSSFCKFWSRSTTFPSLAAGRRITVSRQENLLLLLTWITVETVQPVRVRVFPTWIC